MRLVKAGMGEGRNGEGADSNGQGWQWAGVATRENFEFSGISPSRREGEEVGRVKETEGEGDGG